MDPKKFNHGYGVFGNLSKTYDTIRPEMPSEIIDDLFRHFPKKSPQILDLGCGTGIITRQLNRCGATVIGTDIDSRMIDQAKQYHDNIEYLTAPTEKLPLSNSDFDAATAFSSFHWFANEKALKEIKRVLKRSGYFFIVNRNQVGEARKHYLNILSSFINEPIPNAKKDYRPADLLKSSGFLNIEEGTFSIVENLSVNQALTYVKSTSLWNLIPDLKKDEALNRLTDFFERRMINGYVQRPIQIKTVLGKKE